MIKTAKINAEKIQKNKRYFVASLTWLIIFFQSNFTYNFI